MTTGMIYIVDDNAETAQSLASFSSHSDGGPVFGMIPKLF